MTSSTSVFAMTHWTRPCLNLPDPHVQQVVERQAVGDLLVGEVSVSNWLNFAVTETSCETRLSPIFTEINCRSNNSFCLCSVLEKMRAQINARGAKTIRGLGRVFRNFDSFDGNKKVDAQEFFSGLKEIQVDVTEAEAKVRSGSKQAGAQRLFSVHNTCLLCSLLWPCSTPTVTAASTWRSSSSLSA